jgi:ribosome maturation factor RimP
MASDQMLQKIENLAGEVAAREGVRVYDIEFAGGAQGRTLRVFIDKEGGVSIEDCANVSRGLNLMLDVEDPIPGGKYNLEVSSPGMERTLRKPWHFTDAVGKKVWMKLNQSLEAFGVQNKTFSSAKQVTEVLQGSDESGVKIELQGEQVLVPFAAIEKAKLVVDFDAGKGQKKESNKEKNRTKGARK